MYIYSIVIVFLFKLLLIRHSTGNIISTENSLLLGPFFLVVNYFIVV
jgi:hypothetical protein